MQTDKHGISGVFRLDNRPLWTNRYRSAVEGVASG
jgi:hypothetical protein